MALLFMDSFDHYATADAGTKWTNAASSSGTITIGAFGRHSSNGFRSTTGAGGFATVYAYLSKTLAPSGVGFVVGLAVTFQAAPTGNPQIFLAVADSGTIQVGVRCNTDMTLSIIRGSTVLATSTSALTVGVSAYVEFKGTIDPASGSAAVKVNGLATGWPTFSGNTRNTSNTSWNAVAIGNNVFQAGLSTTDNTDIDDCYVMDQSGGAPWADYLGDVRVDPRYPTGVGNSSGWTPSTGSNWQNVDDTAPNGDTDYNSAASVLSDTFVTQDAPVVGAVIYGVQHNLNFKKSDAGTCTVAPVIRRGGTDYVGADQSPSTSYGYALVVAQTDPSTSAQWTEANFNGAEFGYKRTS